MLSQSQAPVASSLRREVSAGSTGQPHITGLVSRVGERLELCEVRQRCCMHDVELVDCAPELIRDRVVSGEARLDGHQRM